MWPYCLIGFSRSLELHESSGTLSGLNVTGTAGWRTEPWYTVRSQCASYVLNNVNPRLKPCLFAVTELSSRIASTPH
ncbi:hypothetical protein RSOLAG1IB_00772 [Rhizoctonia solani AG-1 IB]|uniref:Uncharacterized protein n=1 Tax=Thanatephorus cucumeris (strain AG1-IB / isolate 7/3/14) TaxID=1108050 RepID=A0A0B7F7P1_THACB|nr:hypothetical protein RSOLAG1IB_00772 [Rhizoctonia solani AG-1 IB]